jgi:hypothetical protein
MRNVLRLRLRFPLLAVVGLLLLSAPAAPAAAAVIFNNWSSNGPLPAPTKAVVKALALAPTLPLATVYLGSDGGGIYTMSEGGGSWSAANAGLKNKQIQALAVHPVDPRVVYAGTREGVFKTSDGGLSWNGLASGLASSDVRSLAIDPQTAATLYAGTAAGVFKSVNGGASWVAASAGLSPNVRALLINPTSTATLYAATDTGVFQSLDGGTSWNPANSGLNNTDVLCLAWAGTAPAATIFAGTNGGGVFISSDGAATWSADNAGPLASLVVGAILIDNPQAPTLAYAGTANGSYKQSFSAGTWNSWAAASTGLTVPPSIHALANNPASRATLYAGSDLGAFRSTNSAGSWSPLATGLRQGSALAIKPSDATVIVAGLSGAGIYRSSDSASSWLATTGSGPVTPTALLYDPAGTTLYAGSGNGVFRSADDGASWSDISSDLPNTDVRALILASGNVLHAGSAEGVFLWNSGTLSWAPYGGGQPSNSDVTGLVYRAPSSLFAGTNGGGVFRSDAGGSWTQVNSGLSNTVVNALTADASYLYAGTAAGVFRSADNGNSWNAVNSGITNLNIRSLGAALGAPPFLTAGSGGGGVFFSTNSGDVWIPMNTGLTDKTVTALAANSGAKKVYAASAGARIFGLKLSPVSAISPAAALPASPLDLGGVNVADTKPTVFSLQNTGTLQLNIASLTLSGTNSGQFSIVLGGGRQCTLPTATIEAGDYCTVVVNFTPTTTGTKTATLTVASDAPNQPVTTYLVGKGGFPPQAVISSPASGASVRNPLVISGTALDKNQLNGSNGTGATLAKVEISTDGGTTWNSAVKNPTLNSWTQWSYSWSATPLPLNGPYQVSARATDSNGFVQSALSTVSVTVDNTPPVSTITSKPKLLDNSASGTFGFSVDKPGSTSQCQIDGGAWVPCSSPFAYSSLAEGSHSFSLFATDPVGNLESPVKSYSWSIDTIPPVTAISSGPAPYTQLSDASLVFSANETNATFLCTLDGVAAACSSPKNYTNLTDGPHSFTVRSTDLAGNTAATAPTTQSYSWIVDKNNKPVSTVNVPTLPLTGLSYSFSGTATDSVSGVRSVSVSINNGGSAAATDSSVSPAQPWSSWSYLWNLPMNGVYTLQSLAADNAGNLQASPGSASFVVANPVPDAQLVTPASAALIGASSPRIITGTAQPAVGGLPLQKVQVTVFPSANPPANPVWIDANGTNLWSYNWQFPADGSYTVQARALDVAPNLSGVVVGNTSVISSRNVTIDTVAPAASINAPPNANLTGRVFSLTGTADDPAPGTGVQQVSIVITDGTGQVSGGSANYNGAAKTWSYTSGNLPDGSYAVQAIATDYAGNQQASAVPVTIVIDNVPPVSTITGRPASISRQLVSALSFTASEPATFSCTLDGVTAPCVCSNGSPTSCTQNYSGLSAGLHTFSVLARDTAGNLETVAKSASWRVDLVNPTVTAATPAPGAQRIGVAGTKLTVSFSEDIDPASITSASFYLDHGASGTVSYDPATRSATLTPDAPLAYTTTYTATVSTGVTDLAGNGLASNYTWSFSTDPEGDVDGNGRVDIADAMLCLKMAVGLVTPTAQQRRQADLAPFKNGKPFTDGNIDASDALIILSKVVGLISW